MLPDITHILATHGASVSTVSFKAVVTHLSGSPHQQEVKLHLTSTNSTTSSMMYIHTRVLPMLPSHLGQGTVLCFSNIERKVHVSGRIYLRTRGASALRVFPLQATHSSSPVTQLLVDMYAAALLGNIDITAMQLVGNVASISKVSEPCHRSQCGC